MFSPFMFIDYKLKITPIDHLYENSSIKLAFVQPRQSKTIYLAFVFTMKTKKFTVIIFKRLF